jgi:hypothetical protein
LKILAITTKYIIYLVFILSLVTIVTYLHGCEVETPVVGNAAVSIISFTVIAGIVFNILCKSRREGEGAIVFIGFTIGAFLFVLQTIRTALK